MGGEGSGVKGHHTSNAAASQALARLAPAVQEYTRMGYAPMNQLKPHEMTLEEWDKAGKPGDPKTPNPFGSSRATTPQLMPKQFRHEQIVKDAINKGETIPEKVLNDHPDAARLAFEKTEKFKTIFGNSKVVEDNGRPLVVYHGGSVPIEKLPGQVFFTDDKSTANWFGVMSEGKGQTSITTHAYLKIEKPLTVDAPKGVEAGSREGKAFIEGKIEEARKGGHDGLIINGLYESGHKVNDYVVWSKEQVIKHNQEKSFKGA